MENPLSVWEYPSYIMEKYAAVLFWSLGKARKKPLKKSDFIQVRFDLPALPLAEEIVGLLHEKGMVPLPVAEPTAKMQHDRLEYANNKRLTIEIPGKRELYGSLAGTIRLIAPQSLTHLMDVDPEQSDISRRGAQPLENILHHREQLGEYGWTVGVYPSQTAADASGLSLEDYAQQIKLACMLERGDPVMDWKFTQRKLQALTDTLNALPVSGLRIRSENTDLLLGIGEHRRWISFSGRNMPSYEIYTSPDWRSAEGHYHADLPSFRHGHRISGLTLNFRNGECVTLQAREGDMLVRDILRLDSGANKVGEFSLVDKRFSPINAYMANTLFDENHGGGHGSCHIALGQAYANTYTGEGPLTVETARKLGYNTSALHWDLVNTEQKEVYALLKGGGKELIYEKGEFTLS